MKEESTDILSYPLYFLKICRLYSETNSRQVVIIGSFCVAVYAFLQITIIMQILCTKGDIFAFVSNVEGLGAFAQAAGKAAFLVYNRKNFVELVKATKYFWNVDKCTSFLQTELNNIYDKVLTLEKLFFRSVFVVVCVLHATLLLGRNLLLGSWVTWQFKFLYKTVLIFQMVGMILAGIFLPAFDCVYLAFCTKIIVQFKILCNCFNELKVHDVASVAARGAVYSKMKLYIQHHVFMMKFTRGFQQTYSFVILCEYLTIVSVVCAHMYALFEGDNLPLLIKEAITAFAQLLQLTFYCIPADFVTTGMQEIADAVYASDWYSEYDLKMRKQLMFIIQRSQREHIFTAGGLFEIKSSTLLGVIRVSWSICTLIRALK